MERGVYSAAFDTMQLPVSIAGAQFPGGHAKREVPGNNLRADSQGLPHGKRMLILFSLDDFGVEKTLSVERERCDAAVVAYLGHHSCPPIQRSSGKPSTLQPSRRSTRRDMAFLSPKIRWSASNASQAYPAVAAYVAQHVRRGTYERTIIPGLNCRQNLSVVLSQCRKLLKGSDARSCCP